MADAKNCDIQHYAMNKSRMVRIAEYSRDCIRQLRVDTGIEYEARQGGTLQLFVLQSSLIMQRMILRSYSKKVFHSSY